MLTSVLKFSPLDLCDQGEYRAAAELAGLRVGGWPENVSGGNLAQAEALLVAGIITSMLGGIQQAGDQDVAREMLTEAVQLFGEDSRADTARYWLAGAYYWSGDLNTSLAQLDGVSPSDDLAKFRVHLLRSVIYGDQGFPEKALSESDQTARFYESVNEFQKGRFHLDRGRILRLLNETDRAIVEYDFAIDFFRQVGNVRSEANAANNLAGIYLDTKCFIRAHEYAESARKLFHELGDRTYEAMSWDQTALIYLAEQKFDKAEQSIEQAYSLVFQGEVLNECVTTHDKIKHARERSADKTCATIYPHPRTSLHLKPSPHDEGSSVTMAPQELAHHLIENHPANATALLDLLIWATSARDDPQHEAELDEIEEMLYSKTEDGVKQRAAYRGTRLLRVIPSITSVDS